MKWEIKSNLFLVDTSSTCEDINISMNLWLLGLLAYILASIERTELKPICLFHIGEFRVSFLIGGKTRPKKRVENFLWKHRFGLNSRKSGEYWRERDGGYIPYQCLRLLKDNWVTHTLRTFPRLYCSTFGIFKRVMKN